MTKRLWCRDALEQQCPRTKLPLICCVSAQNCAVVITVYFPNSCLAEAVTTVQYLTSLVADRDRSRRLSSASELFCSSGTFLNMRSWATADQCKPQSVSRGRLGGSKVARNQSSYALSLAHCTLRPSLRCRIDVGRPLDHARPPPTLSAALRVEEYGSKHWLLSAGAAFETRAAPHGKRDKLFASERYPSL